jgi:hypothetical protein
VDRSGRSYSGAAIVAFLLLRVLIWAYVIVAVLSCFGCGAAGGARPTSPYPTAGWGSPTPARAALSAV